MAQCREKHYPYPDENVYLVTGIRTDSGPLNFSNTVPLAIVSRKAEVAVSYFQAMAPDNQKWDITGCVSLDQLRGLRQKMIRSTKGSPDVKELKDGLFASITGKRQAWAIAYTDASGKPLEPEIVMASASTSVKAHAESSGKRPAGMFSMEVLDETISMLESVKAGKAEKIHYATDIDGGELAQELAETRAAMTDVERAEADVWRQRMATMRAGGAVK
jgi:hypothetical protein